MAILQPVLQLGPHDHGRFLSAAEFAEAAYAEPWKYEREQGRLIVMPPDGPGHDRGSEPVRDYLGAYRLAHPDLVDGLGATPDDNTDGLQRDHDRQS